MPTIQHDDYAIGVIDPLCGRPVGLTPAEVASILSRHFNYPICASDIVAPPRCIAA